MTLKELRIQVKIQISEHSVFLHMMPIYQLVRALKCSVASGIQEKTPSQSIFSIHIFVQIFLIIFSLNDRIVNLCSLQRHPGCYIRIHFQEFIEGRTPLIRSLTLQFFLKLRRRIVNAVVSQMQ